MSHGAQSLTESVPLGGRPQFGLPQRRNCSLSLQAQASIDTHFLLAERILLPILEWLQLELPQVCC